MREAVIVAGARTAVGKAPRGALRNTRPDDLAATVIVELLKRANALDTLLVEDVILGCAIPESVQGFNVARVTAQRARLPDTIPGQTVNRFCASGLQAIALAAQQIMAGQGECIIAGGTESMSLVPIPGRFYAPNPTLASEHPGVYLAMGLTAENVAQQWHVSREDQDAFALQSHQRAVAAQDAGRFDASIVPIEIETVSVDDGQRVATTTVFKRDEGPRRDTSLEALARLPAVFQAHGTVTAGNSSPLNDGAAAVLVMERERAESLGLKPLVRFVSFAATGVAPEVMGVGPITAVPKALKLAGLTLSDIDLIELNEAFASQSLAVIRELGLDQARVNVNGGALALGHPLGCSGAKLTVELTDELRRRNSRYGLVTMCIGGGMGAAGIFENLT